jgi:putative phosphoserine phosphatase/1-acylglycerol-3-phosphate O-acyltransferase
LPIVPIVVSGAHKAWSPQGFAFTPGVTVRTDILEPVATTEWQLGSLERHIAEIRALYLERLPEEQKPMAS